MLLKKSAKGWVNDLIFDVVPGKYIVVHNGIEDYQAEIIKTNYYSLRREILVFGVTFREISRGFEYTIYLYDLTKKQKLVSYEIYDEPKSNLLV